MFEKSLETLMQALENLWTSAISHLPQVVLALVVLIVTAVAVRVSHKVVGKLVRRADRLRPSLTQLILKATRWAVWLLGFTLASIIVFPGFSFSSLLATAGLASVAIGFAFKDIFESFFAGILLLWSFPFEPGDYIEVEDEGILGKVEDIQIRMTELRKPSGELVIIPNAKLYKSPVRILTCQARRRIETIVGVAYDEDIAESREVITAAVESCDTVDDGREIQVFAKEFGASSINFQVTWWTEATPNGERQSRDQVVQAIKRALDDAGIEIPFPYRTLTFKQPLSLHQSDKDTDENQDQQEAA